MSLSNLSQWTPKLLFGACLAIACVMIPASARTAGSSPAKLAATKHFHAAAPAKQPLVPAAVLDNDRLTFTYTVVKGDTLTSIAKKTGCRIPPKAIAQLNALGDKPLAEGTTLKLLRGPLNVNISKSARTMDVYLMDGQQKILVRHVRIAIGKEGRTPGGMFTIASKTQKPTWYPPKSSKYTKPIAYGQKNYPFGKLGLWMPLRGLDSSSRSKSGYAIHSTADQSSIGKAASLGCIRVGNSDIQFLFDWLSTGQSTVTIAE